MKSYFDKHRDEYLKRFHEECTEANELMFKLTAIPYTIEEKQKVIDRNREYIIKHYIRD